ncbi:MAG: hypothetical protein V4691_03720 [Pseudomonadota bacterium]
MNISVTETAGAPNTLSALSEDFLETLNDTKDAVIPAESLWQWFQEQDKNPKNDVMEQSKRYAYLDYEEAQSLIENLKLPFVENFFDAATSLQGTGMNGTSFLRYLMILNNQRPDLKNLRGDNLKYDSSSPFFPEIVKGKLKYRNNSEQWTQYENVGMNSLPLGDKKVATNWEAGNFYCEHIGFILNELGNQADTPFVKIKNKPLVGFLHVPAFQKNATRKDWLRNMFIVMAATVRGYYDNMKNNPAVKDGMRILMTGFGPWDNIIYNPSGVCAEQKENIDQTMQIAFGDDLMSKKTTTIQTPAGDALRYFIRNKRNPKQIQTIDILTKRLPVTDEAINKGENSIQSIIERFKPHAALSMGVDPQSPYTFTIPDAFDNNSLKPAANGYEHNTSEATDQYINFNLENAVRSAWPKILPVITRKVPA